MYELRDYQLEGVRLGDAHFTANVRGSNLLLVAPTGSGKTPVELEILRRWPDSYLITPGLDIVRGMLMKLGFDGVDYLNEEQLALLGQAHRIWTPIRLLNQLAAGTVKVPSQLIYDEAHHEESDSWRTIGAMCGDPPTLGLTATGFRGTPRSTANFRSRWGEPVVLITIRDCVEMGIISFPNLSVVPLVDDDIITVVNGEFSIESANTVLMSRLAGVTDLLRSYYDGTAYDRPTMLALPSTECVRQFVEHLNASGLPAIGVTADTSGCDRTDAFARCLDRRAILVQIKVVSEGVDLPIRRLVDLSPTLSPVRWLQQLGRIMRPGGGSEYVCCCRNLFRHAYLLEGLVPPAVIAKGAELFGGFGERNLARVVGLETLGKFKAHDLRFADGCTGQVFSISTVDKTRVCQYCIIVHPTMARPVIARREYHKASDPKSRGKWAAVDSLPDGLVGYASVKPSAPTPRMMEWWNGAQGMRGAAWYGLDEGQRVTWKNFQALPVLAHLQVRFSVS